MVNPLKLVTPFPPSELPSLFLWIASFKDMVLGDNAPQSIGEFVDDWQQKGEGLKTWAVMRGDEFGGYIEYDPFVPLEVRHLAKEGTPQAGYCEALFKQSFWGNERTVPILDEVMEQLFASEVELVLFRPFQHNKAIRAMVRDLGAREVGPVSYGETRNHEPVTRMMFALVAQEWSERFATRSAMRIAS